MDGIEQDITEEEIYIQADYNRLKQTIVNIIKNSRESIPESGVIKLSTNKNKNNVKIYIEDNGIGMTKEELSKIKEAFFSTKQTGTGLGVYMANEIITAHQGTLEYFSKKNLGTRVVITLPIA
ncbi:ATP-binding protein [bacterium]|nr:ATP-binding protein [bacterium]